MKKIEFMAVLFFFFSTLCFGNGKNELNSTYSFSTKIYWDGTGKKNCTDISENDFTETPLPYYPGFKKGNFWFDIEINKENEMDTIIFNLLLDIDFRDYMEAYIQSNDSWKKIKKNGNPSITTQKPVIPLLKELHDKTNIIHIRICMTSSKGTPINIKLIANKKLFKSTSIFLIRFSFNVGICTCLFFGLLLTGILLKDPAYLLIALSSFLYILRDIEARNVFPLIIWNPSQSIIIPYRIEYLMDSLEILTLTLGGYYFTSVKKKTHAPKRKIAIIESVIIESLLIMTMNSRRVIFITFSVIFIIQRIILISVSCSFLKSRENPKDSRIIFLCGAIVFFFSAAFKILLLARNIARIHIPDIINLDLTSTSLTGFLMLFIPPLYLIGKRFNIRYQHVQKEYQELESKFMKQNRLADLIGSVSVPISKLASSVLNSASILSKLNFSAVNAEYIELIKRESAKINDLLVGIRFLEGSEEIKKTPILLLNFLNSCMTTIRRIGKERNCTVSLTTAIANDTIISADPRILQLLFIINPSSIINLSKPHSKISILMEEHEKEFTMTIANKFESESLDSPHKIQQALNELSYFDFLNEISKIYSSTFEIKPLKDSCRTIFRFNLEKIEDSSSIKIVTDKTTFAISDNSIRLFNDVEKIQSETTTAAEEKKLDVSLQSMEEEKMQPAIKDVFDQFELSTREKEIATLIIEGKSDKEIAFLLNISPQTVATHDKKIFKKTGVHSRVELINKVR